MKPAYTEAANELLGTDHSIGAVDCTKNRKLASRFGISGYPTLKYFKDGEQPSDYDGGRDKDSIVNFLIQYVRSFSFSITHWMILARLSILHEVSTSSQEKKKFSSMLPYNVQRILRHLATIKETGLEVMTGSNEQTGSIGLCCGHQKC